MQLAGSEHAHMRRQPHFEEQLLAFCTQQHSNMSEDIYVGIRLMYRMSSVIHECIACCTK